MIFAIYRFVPYISSYAARNLPQSWENSLGEYTVGSMISGKDVCKNPDGVKALEKLVNILSGHSKERPIITPKVVKKNEINAFAAAGGNIVIFSKLIEKADDPEELAGVIAHEIGHIIKRHPTQSLVRALGLDIVVNIAFGGGTAASAGNYLLQLRYSRNFEREADEIATQILYNANIDNRSFMKFFIRLGSEDKIKDDNIFSHISTHPANSERIETIYNAKNTDNPSPILNGDEWKLLKNICVDKIK
ncbi:MAG: M48 family metallopeptidase [Pseudomonadota bacterium]